MNSKRAWSSISLGLREPLIIFIITGIIALIGHYSKWYNVYDYLALWPPAVLQGHLWQLVTYAFVPGGPADLIFNLFLFALLGTRLVRGFGRGQFWLYCLIGALATALIKMAFSFVLLGLTVVGVKVPMTGMVGLSGVIFAQFAAWFHLFGNEEVMMMAVWRMRMRTAILITAGLIIMFSLCTWLTFLDGLAILGGGATGWLYLVAREQMRMRQPAQTVPTDRISRLEV